MVQRWAGTGGRSGADTQAGQGVVGVIHLLQGKQNLGEKR